MPRRRRKPAEVAFPAVLDHPPHPAWDLGTLAQYTVLYYFREALNRRMDVLVDADIEGVHKIRVAARRTRTALQTFGTLWDAGRVEFFLDYLGGFAKAFNVARDLDVMVVYLDERRAKARGKRAAAYASLHRHSTEQRAAEQSGLVDAIAEMDKRRIPAQIVKYFSRTPGNLWKLEAADG